MFELAEADDDVGHLDAGVVDVVLHFDGRAAEAQHAHERVAERGVPQMADVRRLVRVDGGVLDDRSSALAGSTVIGDRPARSGTRDRAGTRGRSR